MHVFKIVCKNGNKIKIKKYINSVLRICAELCLCSVVNLPLMGKLLVQEQ